MRSRASSPTFLRVVPDRDGEHAVDVPRQVGAVLFVQVRQHFGVAMRVQRCGRRPAAAVAAAGSCRARRSAPPRRSRSRSTSAGGRPRRRRCSAGARPDPNARRRRPKPSSGPRWRERRKHRLDRRRDRRARIRRRCRTCWLASAGAGTGTVQRRVAARAAPSWTGDAGAGAWTDAASLRTTSPRRRPVGHVDACTRRPARIEAIGSLADHATHSKTSRVARLACRDRPRVAQQSSTNSARLARVVPERREHAGDGDALRHLTEAVRPR